MSRGSPGTAGVLLTFALALPLSCVAQRPRARLPDLNELS